MGIGAVRFVRSKGSSVVLIPAPDVLELAEQAKAAKPVVEKSGEPRSAE